MKQNMVAGATMQLFMRTLQAGNMELSQQVQQAVAANPALEELPPLRDAETESAPDHEATRRHAAFMNAIAEEQTLQEHLEQQIRTSDLPKDIKSICLLLIDNLDEHGRFSISPHTLAEEQQISPERLRRALKEVQELEPAGVGATCLQESLIIQLRRAGESKSLAMKVLQEHWQELINHRYEAAARTIGTDTHLVQMAARRIAKLNPDPGSAYARVEQNIITPDIIVTCNDGEPDVQLTGEGIPRLALSADYRNMMAEHAEKPELRQYLSRCFREGRELIRAIDQRQQTILSVARAIVSRQREFFFHGTRAMQPLRMEDIADDTGLHVSTISRAVNGKYLRCEFGVWELRQFFTTAIHGKQEDQADLSAKAVQARIRQLIDEESPSSPLSDADIAATLADEDIIIARRTVAKYREALRILPAHLRRNA